MVHRLLAVARWRLIAAEHCTCEDCMFGETSEYRY
jgi:hypothetical protein